MVRNRIRKCKECGIIYKGLVCPNCSHKWDTSSKLAKVTCPSCNLKIPNPNFKKKENEKQFLKKIKGLGKNESVVFDESTTS